MTDYEEKFHLQGVPINRCVGTKEVLTPEPAFQPIPRPDENRREAREDTSDHEV
jgi:tRNA (guanine-N7-)-methyltransferase